MKRSTMLLGAGLLLAMAPQAMAQGPQKPGSTQAIPGEAAPAVPGQVTTSTGGATPGETSPALRPPRPGPNGQQAATPPGGAREQPNGTLRQESDQGQRR